ncbi:hypothetical protein DVS77_32270 [Mycolicibacterium moriokaense]|nr:hypothetical protein DVS77_32270 [Mycolicibacterium moriokaense]
MVQEKGAPGDFDYLLEEADGSDGAGDSDGVDGGNGHASEIDLDHLRAEEQPQGHNGFDAFDENTWDHDFAPTTAAPWYRSAQARTLLIASAAAVAAIVVSVVLLLFRSSSPAVAPSPVPSQTPVTTPLATTTSQRPPAPPPPPPAPPPPPEPSTMNEAPAVVRPTARPRPSKQPEINVTRTQETRSPISVAPQQRAPR